ncbi:MAG: DUF4234 domain-containing protein [Thermodesulfobacteriota bacterium]|nr:DUF4234 domain-containing protein [Thermodesulfobacteriota bacterium]
MEVISYLPEYKANIVKNIILSILTCGLYNIFWQYQQIKVLNILLKLEEFKFSSWFFLSLITCGLYHLYHEYLMGRGIVEVQKKYGIMESDNLPGLSIILSLLGLSLITDAIQQKEINIIIDSFFKADDTGRTIIS